MMTVPMDNSSAPSRELVEHLFNKNIELENGLRMASKAKVPSDPNAWLQMRENSEAIILADHDFSELHEIEQGLWQLHYRRIEEFRLHINAALASAASVTSLSGKAVVRPDRLKKIRSVFKSFLSEATGFYHDLILKIRAKYGLPLGYFSGVPENQIALAKDGKKSAEMKKGLMSCHRCLIYLGDLARYKGLYGEGDSVARDYAAALSYYIQAASLCPTSGNPHHQNRQSYSQLSQDAKVSSVKSVPVRMSGRGRGRGEMRIPSKNGNMVTAPLKETAFSIPETFKAFRLRFVRLNGILFTRTSLETFGEVLSLAIRDLDNLLSSGPEEELNFGSDAAENGLFIIRMVSILIFTVHNVNKESEGQSYDEILQCKVLLQNAFTAAFEFMGHLLKRCMQLQDILSSYLLPAVLVFIEWLACHPEIAGGDVDEKQATARSFFWAHCISFLNKLILSGLVSIDGDGDETCFSDMSRYDEDETGNRLALWEDFELRGFLPLVPAQLILDFSRKHSFASDGSNKEKRARVQRILAAGRALMNVVKVDHQGICFDRKLKRFAIGIEPQRSEDDMVSSPIDVSISNGMKQGVVVDKTMKLGVMQSKEQLYMEGEEEDEVIVFKPTIAEKHADIRAPKSAAYEILKPVESSQGDSSYAEAFSWPPNNPLLQTAALNAGLGSSMRFANVVSQPLQQIYPSTTSKLIAEKPTSFSDGLRNLSIAGNGLVAKSSLQEDFISSQPPAFSLPSSLSATGNGLQWSLQEELSVSQPPAFSLPFSLSASGNGLVSKPNLQEQLSVSQPPAFSLPSTMSSTGNGCVAKLNFQEELSVSQPPAFPHPFPVSAKLNTGGIVSRQTGVSEAVIPSKLDAIMLSSASNDDPIIKLPNLQTSSRRSPVSRPIRHFGPPPGFNPVHPKQLNGSMGALFKNEHLLVDDYSWLDGYQLPSFEGTVPKNSLIHMGHTHLHVNGHSEILTGMTSTGMTSFPFPGKHVPTVQAQAENQKKFTDYQLLQHLKLCREHQLHQGNQQSAPLSEQDQGQSLWSGQFFV
ncbi:nonsense-mediated mRNA decay factor SMG7-like isoform X2 [Magnolia sinica]|uniref:nonsense-mediated mRNA decay factor SMG7-like isoform X2 n=1 Tax=Magnolia sinica TaxID=86752 RepID=UPI002658A0F7|nr:nonsense-mediated mRNA decay factor SMG7-like isoform X2 [Magnolia sinica]